MILQRKALKKHLKPVFFNDFVDFGCPDGRGMTPYTATALKLHFCKGNVACFMKEKNRGPFWRMWDPKAGWLAGWLAGWIPQNHRKTI